MVQEIVKRSYYHINRQANQSPYPNMLCGDTIDIGKSINPFFGFYDTYQRTYKVTETQTGIIHEIPAIRYLELVQENKITSNNLPNIALETAKHFQMLSRELLWENVRLSEHPDAPSRQRCLFLIESISDLDKWKTYLQIDQNNNSVVRVQATGKALRVDSNYLTSDSELLSTWSEKAHKYWNGEISENPTIEILFEGKVEIIEII